MVHGTVGTQHAAMAIYNAYCDRVPVLIFTGNAGALNERRPGVEWFHSVQDGAATVRDFVKWDDYPMSLQHFAESTVRGHALACAQPPGPVFIVADTKLQEDPLDDREQRKLKIPRLVTPSQTSGDANALREAAKMLVAAEAPVIIADRYARSQAAMDDLVRLAELLQAPVVDNRARMNMPNTHYLCQTERAGGLLGRSVRSAQCHARPAGAHRNLEDKEGGKDHQHLDPRFAGPFELPGFPALCERRHQHHRGCANDLAIPDRGRAARDHLRREDVDRDARRQDA
jgi:thiamine pyrophosphate-dependent acetolactate synthase large subunit-like protein